MTQLGVHFEEVSKMSQALSEAGAKKMAREQLRSAGNVLSYTQRQFKPGVFEITFDDIDRVALLDALCNQIVNAVGVAHMFGMNIEGALKEVADSNDSKFGKDGQPIFNDQAEIMKGPRYKYRNLAAYTLKRSPANA